MIIVRIVGGIGNQMFQYALGRVLSLKNITELKFDFSLQINRHDVNGSEIESIFDIFRINKNIASSDEIKKFTFPFSRNRLFNKINMIFKKEHNVVFREGVFFYPEILNLKGDYFLNGYWQSYKYFQGYEEIIKKDFEFKKDIIYRKELKEKILSTEAVSIHVRKGDYLNKANKKLFYDLQKDYYAKCIDIILSKVSDPTFFVFTNDAEWCEENLNFIEKKILIIETKNRNSWEDMQLMTLCKHNITANSTFSWWGAYLNKNKEKIIIGPEHWFNDSNLYNIHDIIPNEWILV